ncbi:GNAT family N-acetyltransferase [Polycladidibacter hongkongensis]|uniref:GNAT family N-acetyltransferase n=1 Tax=Polycladidibacter hongkongensis TaxID=1647556 RepID=UPI000830AA73|nr:GNAT family N-acetyltransferase [Pseudovibrio hongkongensis]
MVITGVNCSGGSEPLCSLSRVLRLEQANLTAFPSARMQFDRSWITRLTPGNPSRRLNSLNVYERQDKEDAEQRLMQVRARFVRAGVPLCVRWTPLMPKEVEALAEELCPKRVDETIVLERDIWAVGEPDLPDGYRVEQLALPAWIKAFAHVGGTRADVVRPEALHSLEAALGAVAGELLCLAVVNGQGAIQAVLVGIVDDDCLGLFDVATHPDARRKGLARALVVDVQRRGAELGARSAWLQVVASNAPAWELYTALGYKEAYRYHYMQPE